MKLPLRIESTLIKDSFSFDEDIPRILDFIGYSNLNEVELVKKLAFDLNKEIPSFLYSLDRNEKMIKDLKLLEEECDILEISLANLKVEYDEILNSKNTKEELESLKTDFNDMQFEIKHSHLLNQAYSFLNQEPVNKNILNMFRFVKHLPSYELIVEKQDLIRQIEGNEVLNCIFMDLIHNTFLNIDELEKKYSLDKVLILKIVYGMTNNGIVSFDKEKGIITLRK